MIKDINIKFNEKLKKMKIVIYQDRNLKEITIQNSLNIIYNLSDFLNKIIFGFVVYLAAVGAEQKSPNSNKL